MDAPVIVARLRVLFCLFSVWFMVSGLGWRSVCSFGGGGGVLCVSVLGVLSLRFGALAGVMWWRGEACLWCVFLVDIMLICMT